MDNSETYKLMCQMAVKAHPETFYRSSFDSHDFTFKVDGNDLLWPLFRQDQLQEMWLEGHDCIPVGLTKLLSEFLALDFKYSLSLLSMEQLWLAFVMKEKHEKVWTGTEWKEER